MARKRSLGNDLARLGLRVLNLLKQEDYTPVRRARKIHYRYNISNKQMVYSFMLFFSKSVTH
jgi:hypothetical protein